MKVKIYSPTKNPMQSGQGKAGNWEISFPSQVAPSTDPLTGWTGMGDTSPQVKLSFATKEEAIEYTAKNNIEYEVADPKKRIIKPKSYSANFAYRTEDRA